MAKFVQIVEFKTDRPVRGHGAWATRWSLSARRHRRRLVIGSDRAGPATFSIIEFDSWETMENSNRPETSEFAAQMAKLCDGPPTFRNLDVERTWEP